MHSDFNDNVIACSYHLSVKTLTLSNAIQLMQIQFIFSILKVRIPQYI